MAKIIIGCDVVVGGCRSVFGVIRSGREPSVFLAGVEAGIGAIAAE